MQYWRARQSARVTQILALGVLLIGKPGYGGQQNPQLQTSTVPVSAESALVRVDFTIVTEGAPEPASVAEKHFPGYRPKVIETFPSTGFVLDEKHIVTFLGYSWVDCRGADRRVDVTTATGKRLACSLIGIDQTNGVAVVKCLAGKLVKTPLCQDCEMRDGTTIVTPVSEPDGGSQLFEAQVLGVGRGGATPGRGWAVTVNRPLPGIGLPILDTRHRVLGFVANQEPSAGNPNGTETLVYPISQLLTSAEKVLRAGGDIRTGWLGVFIGSQSLSESPVVIDSTEPGSPAEKAGLRPKDILARWNGEEVPDVGHYIQKAQETPIGTKVKLGILRQGKPLTVSTVIAARPVPKKRVPFDFRSLAEMTGPDSQGGSELRKILEGIGLVQVTLELSDSLHSAGFLVSSVDPDTVFSQAGVLVGDVIVAVDGQPVRDSSSFVSHLRSLGRGGRLLLRILRKGQEQNVPVSAKR